MKTNDYITMVISIIALLCSFSSLIIVFFTYRRGVTKLKIKQLYFNPSPFGTKIIPNRLFLDKNQKPSLWEVMPIVYLVVYLKIDNLSYEDITISNFIINDEFLVSKINIKELREDLSLVFFASEKCANRELEDCGCTVEISAISLKPNDYSLINIGERVVSKSSIEGIIVICGNQNLYNVVNDGINKLTIITPDKKFNSYIEIDKTVVPRFPNQ